MKYFLLSLVLQMAFIVQPVCLFAQFEGGGKAGNANKKITNIRKERLETHFAAFVTWVDYHCELTAEQKAQFNTAIKEEIAKAAELYGPPRRLAYRSDYWPIQMVIQQGAAWEIYHATLEERLLKILSAEQKETFHASTLKRKQRLHELFLERVMKKAGEELTLSAKQQQQLKRIFPEHLPFLENGLYYFKPRTQYIHEKSILGILTHPPMAYSREQWELLNLLRQNRGRRANNHLHFRLVLTADIGTEGWRERIDIMGKDYQAKMQTTLQNEISKHFLINHLSPKDLRYLKIASKGAAIDEVNKWRKKALLTTAQYEKIIQQRPGMNFSFTVPGIDSSKITQHPLWQVAVKKVKASIQEGDQGKTSEFTMKYALAMLDQELWLTTSQYQKMKALYQNSRLISEYLYRGEQYELHLLATIIYAKEESELESILNKQQLNAFKTLKNQYEIEDSFLRYFKKER